MPVKKPKETMFAADYIRLGKRLTTLRQRKGLTLYALSRQVDISQTSLSQYERAERTIPVTLVVRLCRFYGIRTDSLLKNLFVRNIDESIKED